MYQLEDRTWTTHDGSRLANPTDSPRILLGNKGDKIPESRAHALGLIHPPVDVATIAPIVEDKAIPAPRRKAKK